MTPPPTYFATNNLIIISNKNNYNNNLTISRLLCVTANGHHVSKIAFPVLNI